MAALACGAIPGTPAAEELPEADRGIAARYPGDVGIAADRDVVLVENFEAGSVADVFARWDDVSQASRISLVADAPPASRGRRSLLLHKSPGDGGTGAGLYRRLLRNAAAGHSRLHLRMYVKIHPGSDPIGHLGTSLGGHHPTSAQPRVRAGRRPAGHAAFWTSLEPYGASWRWDFYTYWSEMRSWQHDDGTGTSFFGNAFVREGAAAGWVPAGPGVRRGVWECIELMVELNDPVESSNGEQAFWVDGRLVRRGGQVVSHLGAGFPKGRWLRDKWIPDASGEPFDGFRWRTSPELLLNFVWLYVYTEEDLHGIRVSFDDVVVATRYIGPLYPGPREEGR